jgi:hypothetical protein
MACLSNLGDAMRSFACVLGCIVLALALGLSFARDFSLTMQNGAVDFRNRIIGARLLEHGIDPYHYIWHPGDPAEFCDIRNNPRMTVSKTSVTPAMLVVFAPLAALPYRTAQITWFVAQWLFLLGTAWFWLRCGVTPLKCWLAAIFVVGFTFTPGWQWEMERGQCYTLLVFLLAYVLASWRGEERANALAGFVAGLLVALRPPCIVLLPFLALHRRGQLRAACVGLFAGVVVPMLLHPPIWIDYASGMVTASDYYRHSSLPPRPEQAFPAVIEGVPLAIMGRMASFPFVDVSVYALARRFGLGVLPDIPLMLLFGALFFAWLWWKRREVAERVLPGLAAWVFLADFLIPTPRWGYYDVMILNVILAQIVVAKKFSWSALPGPLGVMVMWSYPAFAQVPLAFLFAPQILFVVSAVLALIATGAESRLAISNSTQARP